MERRARPRFLGSLSSGGVPGRHGNQRPADVYRPTATRKFRILLSRTCTGAPVFRTVYGLRGKNVDAIYIHKARPVGGPVRKVIRHAGARARTTGRFLFFRVGSGYASPPSTYFRRTSSRKLFVRNEKTSRVPVRPRRSNRKRALDGDLKTHVPWSKTSGWLVVVRSRHAPSRTPSRLYDTYTRNLKRPTNGSLGILENAI